MPSKFLIRNFKDQGIYHIYNKGLNFKEIFADTGDYELFLYYLYIYLTPIDKVLRKYRQLPPRLFNKNLSKQVDLLGYCLMPNHYHLLLQQKGETGISQLMKQLSNAYTQYFNHRYRQRGTIFEGSYKSVAVEDERQLSCISRFIHLHPFTEGISPPTDYPWSSYHEYIDDVVFKLCRPKVVLGNFPSVYAYKKFVQDEKDYRKKMNILNGLTFD